MRCPRCGTQNEDGATFCTQCGTDLGRVVCPRCGARVASGRFCSECGADLSGAPSGGPPTPPPPPVRDDSALFGMRQSGGGAPPPPPPIRPAAQGGGGCVGCFLKGCLVLIVLLVVIVGAGYYAVRTGKITQQSATTAILNLAGKGPADIEVDNFRDDAIQVSFLITQTTATPGTPTPGPDTISLKAFDIRTYHVTNTGKYRVSFKTASGGSNLGTCNLNLVSGDNYQFVLLPDRIAVNRVNKPSTVGTDFDVQSSSLCR